MRDVERTSFVRTYNPKVQLIERKVRVSKLRVDTEPNAPLLSRIVKNPYAETTGSPRRTQVYQPVSLVSVRPSPTPDPVAESRAARGPITAGNPVKTLEIHPDRLLSPPSIDAWLASREA
jgi:hypothetical protein